MFISALISLLHGPDAAFYPLLLAGLITTIAGATPYLLIPYDPNISSKEGYFIVIVSWLMCCISGVLPYWFYGGEFSLINAWFESVSGYSTTGASILNDVEALPKGLVFFRSCTAWMGGLGVILFILLFLPAIKNLKFRLAKVEISPLAKDNFKYRTQQTIRIIGCIYVGMTALETILLCIAGMSFFDAVNHSFSTIATCGFSTKNISILYYNNIYIEMIVTLFMYLSGLHFGLIFLLVSGRSKAFFKSPVIRFYSLSLLAGILLMATDLTFNSEGFHSWWTALRYSAFQVVSIASTSGFATANTNIWPIFSILILFYFMFQCACSGSTAGGIKADRMLILFKSIKAQVKKMQHPNAIIPIRIGQNTLESDTISAVAIYIVLYIMIVFISTFLLALMGVDNIMTCFSASLACMSNVGPGFAEVGSLNNYSGMIAPVKFLLAFLMLLGRLEIYGFILLFFFRSWK